MHDDPFARAVERAKAAERAEAEAKRRHVQREVGSVVSSGARTAFRIHLNVFIAVNLLLVVIWATATRGYPWFIYPLLGWGIGLVAHYSATSGLMGSGRSRNRSSRDHRSASPATAPAPAAPAPAAPAPAAPAPAPDPAPAPRAATTTSASDGTTAGELARLHELHQGGVLTDKEFKAAKAKLLG